MNGRLLSGAAINLENDPVIAARPMSQAATDHRIKPVFGRKTMKPDNVKPEKSDSKAPEIAMMLIVMAIWMLGTTAPLWLSMQPVDLPYSEFVTRAKSGEVNNLKVSTSTIEGDISGGAEKGRRFVTVRVDPQLAAELSKSPLKFEGRTEQNWLTIILSTVLPIIFLVAILNAASAARQGGGTAGLLSSMERSGARVFKEEKIEITFDDVAGVDEAQEELKEIIQFLKEPERYSKLGGRLPKGILLVGPPGTGKTLLARAVAGEASVPFFSISGSEFVELYVGVGAARVRDLFTEARKAAPCIIFIDELDALGKARALNPITGGHDEKEQTLNQLLVEIDGFDQSRGVVLLGATNRPEILDSALLRAGRFDRHVLVDRPDKKGRIEILNVHLRKVVRAADVNVEELASMTPGFTGADLSNMVNEAVLLAARRQVEQVEQQDFLAALERLVAGLEKKNRLLNPIERRRVAFHESGHALISFLVPGTDKLQKVSIIPRGLGALGYTLQRPTEDRFVMTYSELQNKLAGLLAGRSAEAIVFGDTSTGAADDLAKATDIARAMSMRYGMNSRLGPVAYDNEPSALGGGPVISPILETRRYSEATARDIDKAIKDLVEGAANRARTILEEHKSTLYHLAEQLLVSECLTIDDVSAIVRDELPAATA
jgi:cell division protease FtsH